MRYLIVLSLLSLITCSQRKGGGIVIAGSTSVQPFIEKLAELYMQRHPDVMINVQGGGSTAGIQATLNKTCNIGTSSRNLKEYEKGLKTIPIAMDGIAVIVHRDNKIEDLTIEQIRGIFSGMITDWEQVGGEKGEIIPVTREEGSGTRGSFEEMIMGEVEISDACLVQDSNGAVREIIATTPRGIGYMSVGLVDERVKSLAIDGIKPTIENLLSCRYHFSRPFLLLLCGDPDEPVKKFIDFVLTPEAQQILEGDGLIPVIELGKQ